MRKLIWPVLFIGLLLWNSIVSLYHMGTAQVPNLPILEKKNGQFIDKQKYGMNHLIVQGNPFERGYQAGQLVQNLLLKQEDELFYAFNHWLPSEWLLKPFTFFGILWFQGAEKYFAESDLQEMYGVSQFAPEKNNYVIDRFTRQVVFHGIHEVGQMTVDRGLESMGCTVAALPWKNQWVLGRNFDFEAGRIFDEEKIVKWSFPEQGHSYVSVIWAGMVGVVTGVNDQGLYISLNAAGSDDFQRVGTPSTLIALKVLQEADSIDEALNILKNEQMFISDIFVLLDAQSGSLYRIEKSPKRFAAIKLEGPQVVTNHFIDSIWQNDRTNSFRKKYLTSIDREQRGRELVNRVKLDGQTNSQHLEPEILKILRDKKMVGDQPLNLGNRKAIDALISTHSVIYNSDEKVLFVGTSPGVSGKFIGYDLKESFLKKTPIYSRELPEDPEVQREFFYKNYSATRALNEAEKLIRQKNCKLAKSKIDQAASEYQEQPDYYRILGDWNECVGDQASAVISWRKSIELHPAYEGDLQKMKKKLE